MCFLYEGRNKALIILFMRTAKEQKRFKKYEEDLAMPKWKFILVYGLSFGILMFIITTVENYFFDKKNFHWNSQLLVSALITISVGGFLFGWMMRKFYRWDYKKLKSKAN